MTARYHVGRCVRMGVKADKMVVNQQRIFENLKIRVYLRVRVFVEI